MAKRSLSTTNITITGIADNTSLTVNTYCGDLLGAAATQRTNILEVYVGGQSTSSQVAIMLLARDQAVATGGAAGGSTTFDAALDAATAALAAPVVVANSFVTLQPFRSTTLHLLNLTFNAFGGIVRWVAAPGEEISIVGTSASTGSISLSGFTGSTGAIVGSHIIYETF